MGDIQSQAYYDATLRQPPHCYFTYTAILEANGTDQTQVLLPMPTEAALMASLTVSSPSASATVNNTDVEPALEVRFSEPTTVRAWVQWSNRSCAIDLTRGPVLWREGRFNLSAMSVGGELNWVHVNIEARWSPGGCHGTWTSDIVAVPGVNAYPGEWFVVC